jgi:5-methylcytosine-specific restriction enzyme A
MPKAAPKPCRFRGCSGLVVDGSGYCEQHAKLKSGWNHPDRGSAAERGYGYAWQQLRLLILRRDCGLCQVCLTQGVVRQADAVDHIVPKEEGGTDDEDNLQSICNACHAIKTEQERRRGVGKSKTRLPK